MMNLVIVLRPYWQCLQDLNDLDQTIETESYLKKWDETKRNGVKYFEPEQILEKSEEERIKFYKTPSDEQKVLIDDEVNQSIKSTDLFVPEQRIFNGLTNQIDQERVKRKRTNSRENVLEQLIDSNNLDESVLRSIENVALKNVRFVLDNFCKKFDLI